MHGDWFKKDRFLDLLQDPWYLLLVRLQSFITIQTYAYWSQRQLQTMHLPITTHSVSSPMGLGSDSKPVKINLLGLEVYLADSMQFMLEYGCRFFDAGCFYIMPSFRADTCSKRHLCQFYHSEIEVPGDLSTVMRLAEEYIRFLSAGIVEHFSRDLILLAGGVEHLVRLSETSIPRITFDAACELLKNDPNYIHHSPSESWRTITHQGETKLIEIFSGFIWLTHQDHLAVPFYQAFVDDSMQKAICADLLFGIGEIIGAGERHRNAEQTRRALKLHAVNSNDYDWYIAMKEKSPLETSGFGMGIERFLLWVMQHDDIRDIQILPRFIDVPIKP